MFVNTVPTEVVDEADVSHFGEKLGVAILAAGLILESIRFHIGSQPFNNAARQAPTSKNDARAPYRQIRHHKGRVQLGP